MILIIPQMRQGIAFTAINSEVASEKRERFSIVKRSGSTLAVSGDALLSLATGSNTTFSRIQP